MKILITFVMAGLAATSMAYGSAVNLIAGYRNTGAGPFSPDAGASAWTQEHQSSSGAGTRSCASCHGTNISKAGRHAKTRMRFEPMALSVHPTRLTDEK